MQACQNKSTDQQLRIAGVLYQNPLAFSNLPIGHSCIGWASLQGSVPAQADYDRPNAQLQVMIRNELAEKLIAPIQIDSADQHDGNQDAALA